MQHKGITGIPRIQDVDKIKFIYLRMPNPINSPVITVPDDMPDQLGLYNYIDRDKQFDKAFLDPLRSITDLIGWSISQKVTLDSFFE